MEPTRYVSYSVKAALQKGVERRRLLIHRTDAHQPDPTIQTRIDAFVKQQSAPTLIIKNFFEALENRRTRQWPVLQQALAYCKEQKAQLLIVELGTLANNSTFTEILLRSELPFFCIDQPFVTPPILEALMKHAVVQRKLHGQLIRKGLLLTSAKSGNPHAAEVINRVNKPKIDTAILFAFLLAPIIRHYRDKEYSQRQMVKLLNEEGFTAPEGGKWVLSQLQKVLDRVRLNEVAEECQSVMNDFQTRLLSAPEIVEALNEKGILPLKGSTWDIPQLKKLICRLEQIKEITLINQFVIDLVPMLNADTQQGLSSAEILHRVEKAFAPDMQSLAPVLESAMRHIPIYLKIVKAHLEQLANVLESEAHHYTKFDPSHFPRPVQQLIQLFEILNEATIKQLDDLYIQSMQEEENKLNNSLKLATTTVDAELSFIR